MKQGYRFDLYDWVISLSDDDYDSYMREGKKFKQEVPDITKETISRYKKANGHLSAEDIMDDLFTEIEADIFLSHSHADINAATVFAGYLSREFGMKSFIDSFVWGNANDLLRQVNDIYSRGKNGRLGYEEIVHTSSQIYVILLGALIKMMDRIDKYILLVSSESLQEDITSSPWIYSEILYSQILCPWQSFNEDVTAHSALIDYPAYTNHLALLTPEIIPQIFVKRRSRYGKLFRTS